MVFCCCCFPSNKENLASWKVQESSYASCQVSVCVLTVLTQSSFLTTAVTEAGVSLCCGEAKARKEPSLRSGVVRGWEDLLTKAHRKWLLNFIMCIVQHFIKTSTKSPRHHGCLFSGHFLHPREKPQQLSATPISLSPTCWDCLSQSSQRCHPGHVI